MKKKANINPKHHITNPIQRKKKKQDKDVGVANPRILEKKKKKNPIYMITT